MPLTRKTRPIGGSLLVSIPSQFAASLGIVAGTPLCIELEKNKIVMTPDTRQDVPGASQTE
ncbi:hypothetical protein RE474_01275 [Methanolobus sediminis]|uniref:SpoVT-AbrB domain-containing protein n=1 Tax=Methanolobus sediminis TaxID=3072978 RepID=A0AA51UN49_9EURY|nr:hypothetical protein [Methanolobus sediminis]WMW25381.1 hypothetical protein RE474_01275 [Methanolobus sediminis]